MANKLLVKEGFRKANSDNLPTVDIQTLKRYIRKNDDNIGPEIANVNSHRAERGSYVECAIGWVQVRRVINISCDKRKRKTHVLKVREKESPEGSFLKEVLDHIETKRHQISPPSFLPQLYMHFTDESHWFQVIEF